MDRSLDEIIGDSPRGPRAPPRGPRSRREAPPPARAPPPRGPRREEYPRDGIRKVLSPPKATNRPDDRTNIDNDWVHDRYDDDRYDDRARRAPAEFDRIVERVARPEDIGGAKLRIDNVHYELTEQDLLELFERIGRVLEVRLLYDRLDRSQGVAFVTYDRPRDARDALTEYDGCNANGQPIRITLLPNTPAPAAKATLFDRVERPSRSLFDRIEGGPDSRDVSRDDSRRRRRNRSDSPRRPGPPPDNVDRYVPRSGARSRSPIRRRGTPRESGRRPGQRREDSDRRAPRGGRTDTEGRPLIGGRPRKTQDELDAEMEDYFKSAGNGNTNGAAATSNGAPAAATDDIDMIE